MKAQQVIFIGGTGRSGTNILKKVFSAHPDVATLPFEYRFIIDPGGVIDFYRSFPVSWSPYRADAELKRFESFLYSLACATEDKKQRSEAAKQKDPSGLEYTPPSYSGWELEKWIPGYSVFVKEMMDSLIRFRYRALWPGSPEGVEKNEMYFAPHFDQDALKPILSTFLGKCFAAICTKEGKRVFLEDNTHNILFAGDLLALTPEAKFIHIVRDPRDVIGSLIKQRWAPTDLRQAVAWYKAVMNEWLSEKKRLPEGRFIEMKFEDLISDTRNILTRLTEFTGIAFHYDMLNIDLKNHNIGRHKRELNDADISLIETDLSTFIEYFGY